MPKTKKFIDKKNSVTFHLVHRSQQDPLAADETAPQRVLVPVCNKNSKQQLNPDQIKTRKEEQQKFGIFFDDDYDYLQHLKDARTLNVEWERVTPVQNCPKSNANNASNAGVSEEKVQINLPSSVFESHVEENIGLLNRADPPPRLRLDLDPDIVAALDGDFNYDPNDELEDNFMELANAGADNDSFSNEFEDDFEDEMDDEFDDEVQDLKSFKNVYNDVEETKTHFTEYSATSSVIKRNKHLTMLDEKFEKMFETYDDDNIGELDPDDTDGYIDPEILLKRVQDDDEQNDYDIDNMTKGLRNYIINTTDENGEYELEKLTVGEIDKDRFDCESILSTTSNIYNHPKLISEPKNSSKIKVDRQTGIPANFLGKQSTNILSDRNLSKLNCEQIKHPGQLYITPSKAVSERTFSSINRKEETKEQKKERKLTCKVMKKERRIERKQNCELFKEERKRQQKIINNKGTILGNKIL